jgi:hypothetical protein
MDLIVTLKSRFGNLIFWYYMVPNSVSNTGNTETGFPVFGTYNTGKYFTAVLTTNYPLLLGVRVYFVKNPQYRNIPVLRSEKPVLYRFRY